MISCELQEVFSYERNSCLSVEAALACLRRKSDTADGNRVPQPAFQVPPQFKSKPICPLIKLSNDNGVTWQADDVISDASSPLPLQPDPNVQPCYAGDYDRSVSDGTAFFITWVDGRTLVSGNPQQDVFFDKVPDGPARHRRLP